MNKLLLFFLLFFSVISASEYPKTFSKLGTPLYKYVKPISKYSDVELLQENILTFEKEASRVMLYGFEVDKSKDKVKIKEYLLELRKLQKSYDYLLHLLHDSINTAIDKRDYKLFLELTNYEFDGLLKNSNLKNKAISFYKKNRNKKRSKVLDKKIKRDKLIEETTKEFYNQTVKSTFDSNAKKIDSKKSVAIKTEQKGREVYITFINKNIYDVTVKVDAVYENIKESENTPKIFVLKANSTMEYTKLSIGHGKTYYQFGYAWIIGSKDAVHDDSYIYRLPYAKGTSHVVSQGFNGKFTHKGNSKYAVDFAMQQGTKIYAARSGIVVKTKFDSNRGGNFRTYAQDGNYVTILHSDGTFGTYYHLMQGGVTVNVGDKVQRGYVIGYSGNTGYSSGPHLHFAVFSALSAKATHTIPIRFSSANGVIDEPTQGTYYTAK